MNVSPASQMWFYYWKWLCDLATQASAFLSLNISSNFRDVISWSMFIHIWLLYECCISQQTLRLKINADADCCCDLCTWNQHTNIIWLSNQAPSTQSLQGAQGTLHKVCGKDNSPLQTDIQRLIWTTEG